MKNSLKVFLASLLIVPCVLILVACGGSTRLETPFMSSSSDTYVLTIRSVENADYYILKMQGQDDLRIESDDAGWDEGYYEIELGGIYTELGNYALSIMAYSNGKYKTSDSGEHQIRVTKTLDPVSGLGINFDTRLLTWDEVTDADKYDVMVSSNISGGGTVTNTVSFNYFELPELSEGDSYIVRVQARSDNEFIIDSGWEDIWYTWDIWKA